MTLFLAPETVPFGVALFIILGLGALELLGLMSSFSVSDLIDHLIPESLEGDGPLGWLHVGRTPILVLLILFLTGFSLAGYAVQGITRGIVGSFLPAIVAVVPATVAGVFVVRALGGLIGKLIPKDETTAVGENQLIGRTGVIIRGLAREGMAAEARVRDEHGATHYLMVEPDVAGETLDEGTDILLVRKVGVTYRAILNPHPTVL